jgi:hypothetical protein
MLEVRQHLAVTVHHGEFTVKALGGHLVKKASQDGTTEPGLFTKDGRSLAS